MDLNFIYKTLQQNMHNLTSVAAIIPKRHQTILKQLLVFFPCLLLTITFSTSTHADHVSSTPPSCPATNFSDFLKQFANDVAIQRRYTRDPLISYSMVDANPEPVMRKKRLSHPQIKFPLLPLATERKQQNLSVTITEQSTHSATALLGKPDTDYQVEYLFVKKNCWMLVQEKNWSL